MENKKLYFSFRFKEEKTSSIQIICNILYKTVLPRQLLAKIKIFDTGRVILGMDKVEDFLGVSSFPLSHSKITLDFLFSSIIVLIFISFKNHYWVAASDDDNMSASVGCVLILHHEPGLDFAL